MLSRPRSALALLVLVLATLLLGGVIVLASRKGPRPGLAHRVSRLWGRTILAACWGRLRVQGREHVDPAQAYVFVSNHQSALDIPVLLVALRHRFGFLAKRELFELGGVRRFFSRLMEVAGHIPVDREEEGLAKTTVRRAKEKLERGESIVVFPEGTRSPTEELLPFKQGAFVIARLADRPVVPVTISGTQRLLHPRRPLRLGPPGTVRVVIGHPIAPRGRRREELAQEVRAAVAENLNQAQKGNLTQA